MKNRIPVLVTCLLVAIQVSTILAFFHFTERHNAQLVTLTETFNAQLLAQTAKHNAQLEAQTATHNDQLLALVAKLQK